MVPTTIFKKRSILQAVKRASADQHGPPAAGRIDPGALHDFLCVHRVEGLGLFAADQAISVGLAGMIA